MIANGYRSGFFSIIGCPNVGKSTLLNTLIGQKIAIVTDRAQTTRNRITGVLTGKGWQMIFLDTPGMTRPKNKLGEYMQKVAENASNDTEAALFLIDATQGVRDRDREILERLPSVRSPKIGVINKSDAASAGAAQNTKQSSARQKAGMVFFLMSFTPPANTWRQTPPQPRPPQSARARGNSAGSPSRSQAVCQRPSPSVRSRQRRTTLRRT